MNKFDIVKKILKNRLYNLPHAQSAKVFAPSNIALCKYWGKRDEELNLPMTSSLSISLGDKGTTTEIKISEELHDTIIVNDEFLNSDTNFYKRIVKFLNLFRSHKPYYFNIVTSSNIPVAAGLASSASGFAALICSLNKLFVWELNTKELSILARFGSGSASRSLWQGFVEWQKGEADDGMDSYAELLPYQWHDLCIGLVILHKQEKHISSREAMRRTVHSSPYFSEWPKKVIQDLKAIKLAIKSEDFHLLGKTAESNAMSMHALMLSAWPPILYSSPETLDTMKKIWKMREEGLSLYYTQDAGPNLKLLFLKENIETISQAFPGVEIVQPFCHTNEVK